jgi:hypothetical protein
LIRLALLGWFRCIYRHYHTVKKLTMMFNEYIWAWLSISTTSRGVLLAFEVAINHLLLFRLVIFGILLMVLMWLQLIPRVQLHYNIDLLSWYITVVICVIHQKSFLWLKNGVMVFDLIWLALLGRFRCVYRLYHIFKTLTMMYHKYIWSWLSISTTSRSVQLAFEVAINHFLWFCFCHFGILLMVLVWLQLIPRVQFHYNLELLSWYITVVNCVIHQKSFLWLKNGVMGSVFDFIGTAWTVSMCL